MIKILKELGVMLLIVALTVLACDIVLRAASIYPNAGA